MEIIVKISLACFGWKLATSEGNVLHGVYSIVESLVYWSSFCAFSILKKVTGRRICRDLKAQQATAYILKPLFTCIYCMSSVLTIAYLTSNNIELFQINTAWVMLTVCGLNVVISSLVELSLSMKEFLKLK